LIHLDHAATSFPKPEPVLAAILRWYTELGVSAERGDSDRCAVVRTEVLEARARLGALIGVPAARVAFTSGATESLNLALRALLRRGDAVVTTAFEHSSVVRPLLALAAERALRLEVVPPTPAGGLSVDAVRDVIAAVRPRLVVLTHASNVTGAVLDAAAVCELARRAGAASLLDVSQTAGVLDLRVGADLTAGSAHKGLHGPPGLGFLAARSGLDLPPQKQGGTGSSQALAEHPGEWPQAFEAGTPNTPAILGLGAALRWLEEQRPERLHAAALARTEELEELLAARPNVRLLRPPPRARIAVTSFTHAGYDPAELGAMLAAAGVHVRSGFHCAPWIHEHLGTAAAGTVRMSAGPFVTAADVRAAAAAVPD
jgi:selenocysteine lyase/cysteine desulfurase